MPQIRAKVFHVGGEDVRMRIPILKKMIEKKLDVGKFYDVDITSAQEYDLIGKVKG